MFFLFPDLAVKRKIEKTREKVLHYDRVLQKNSFVQPVPSSTLKKCKPKQKEVHIGEDTNQNAAKVSNVCELVVFNKYIYWLLYLFPLLFSQDDGGMTDLWDDKGIQLFLLNYKAKIYWDLDFGLCP